MLLSLYSVCIKMDEDMKKIFKIFFWGVGR